MKKQILFADGGAQLPQLTPADRTALAASSYLAADHTEKKQQRYGKQKGYYNYFNFRSAVAKSSREALAVLIKRIDSVNIIAAYDFPDKGQFVVVSSHNYRFYGRNLMEELWELNSKVSGLPSKVDDDEYQPTNGRVITVGPKNYCPALEYRIPFDMEAWQTRHDKEAETTTKDAAAAQDKADAEYRQNEADLLAQQAKTKKTLRIVLVALAAVAVVVVLALIFKKK